MCFTACSSQRSPSARFTKSEEIYFSCLNFAELMGILGCKEKGVEKGAYLSLSRASVFFCGA